ncbi:uncharacterized protein BDZ99DRAFT_462584 [Mytilinidion resinicola]|uniref:Secreted protein n=1 Tax=Mytilinidion resinicola TaxID=574789 RepID=A0A6A6YM48_9PEZI|nr:uncharacterized protein BDZ99DRAFT_462584 [Mytilinidion resinicola]KAF2809952.1 hypothetical protein BDZ99DRAFT_462584 [Mytilinidion resinicola]
MSSTEVLSPVYRSGSSAMSELHGDDQFSQQHDENPLEQGQTSSIQATPSHLSRHDPMERLSIQCPPEHVQDDEPPPPYEDPSAGAPQIAPIEYSCENSPQLVLPPHEELEAPVPPPRNPNRPISQISSQPSPLSPETQASARPSFQGCSSTSSHSAISPEYMGPAQLAKAREAGFDIMPPATERTDSASGLPSINIIASNEPLQHIREAGKLMAYLIPFPKPRLQGVDPAKVPNRFLVYTPPTPPLSKPAPGEKESKWHKTQRTWQEDVRKATMSNASGATWKGFKAKTTRAIGRGVSMTKTSNLEFLDRVSVGAIESAVPQSPPSTPDASQTTESPSSLPSALSVMGAGVDFNPNAPKRSKTTVTESKPKALEDLTLIYPPSLPLDPEQIRAEFVESLLRTRTKSQRDAVVASSLLPFAAAVDLSLLLTFGGLSEVSAVWAHSSIRGAKTSKKMTKGLKAAEEKPEIQGCTCGNHEHEFGAVHNVKGKNKGIQLSMQANPRIEVLSRYLEMMCLQREFSMFPQLDARIGDVNEWAVLEAIGWQPKKREGYELDLEDSKGLIEHLTPEQDEAWQVREAKDDLRRIMKKGASEWVSWCKSYQKDAEAALKK